jgi:uncharacterized membrane protein YfhO
MFIIFLLSTYQSEFVIVLKLKISFLDLFLFTVYIENILSCLLMPILMRNLINFKQSEFKCNIFLCLTLLLSAVGCGEYECDQDDYSEGKDLKVGFKVNF